jgi:arylsulfatase A-like enzyme
LSDVHLTYHHVPLLFYAPRMLSQRGVVLPTVVNQVNIAPSILGLLHVDAPAAHWARNVFENDFAGGGGGGGRGGTAGAENFAVFKGSGGTNAVAMARGDLLFVLGDDGKPRLFRYDLGFPPSVQPLADARYEPTARRMRHELEGYVQSALHDLTTHQAGPATAGASAGVALER